jgi:glycosyltransferase involved in cell wall biosynthesis
MLFGGGDQLAQSETRIGINAHLLSPAPGYRRAGIHQYIAQVLHNLPLIGGDCSYHIYTRATDLLDKRDGFHIASSNWPTEQRLIRILWEQTALPAEAARDKIDLLHSMAFVTPLLGHIPSVVTVYDLSFVHYPEAFPVLQRFYLQSQTGRSVRNARRVIAISEAGRQDVHKFFSVPLGKIDVVLPGVEPDYQPLTATKIDEFRERYGLTRPFLLHVGTLQPRKNIPVLLEAISQIDDDDFDLVLAGAKGWLYDEIFTQVKDLGLSNRVRFTGYVRDQDLPFWYNAARALVFPSLYEGFGMPVIEAMACGTPVVAARSSSIPEAGGEAALYFDPHDVGALAQQLTEVIHKDSLVERMRYEGLAQAKRFSWQRAGVETAQVYIKALGDQ